MPLRPEQRRALIRSLIPALLVLLSAGAGAAYDPDASVHGNYRGQCRRLTKQLDYYENTVLPMAIERGNVAWENATNEQMRRLWNKRADLCPKYGKERARLLRLVDRIRAFNKLVAQAGRAAARYFSGGIAP